MQLEIRGGISATTQFAWLTGAAVVGFASSALFSGFLEVTRSSLVLAYGAAASAFLYTYFRSSGIKLTEHLHDNCLLGFLGAILAGAMVVSNVLSQPVSTRPEGIQLIFAILWVGIFYGLVDALLLTVMPVIATWLLCTERGLTETMPGRVFTLSAALLASLVITAAYHLGYPEFRGPQLIAPIIGNALLTAAYLLTRSPLSPILAHIAMHVAAVLHGMETTLQLPPHY